MIILRAKLLTFDQVCGRYLAAVWLIDSQCSINDIVQVQQQIGDK